jgi:hypothetical protein
MRVTLLLAAVCLLTSPTFAQQSGLSQAVGGAAAVAALSSGVAPEGYEVKLIVDSGDFAQLLQALGWLNEDLRRRDVWFIDTKSFTFLNEGQILRARQEDDDLDLTVKLRGSDVDFGDYANLVPREDFKSEIDWIGGRIVSSVSFTRDRKEDFDPDDPLDEFSDRQLRFLRDEIGVNPNSLPLRAFGPIETIKREHDLPGLADELVLEHWTLPDGSIVLEISAMADDAVGAVSLRRRLLDFLDNAGVDLAPQQSSKTRRAMEVLRQNMPG